ncbi:unnamed protein product [Arabis nemorensis]|uniref:Uncharacterized protein n=1 Tax=Arabis nemorensis TaxID=586526 RepID=A0A565CMJ4_9BRAS|nr:unnamed protein product [Arabis nemorensis]
MQTPPAKNPTTITALGYLWCHLQVHQEDIICQGVLNFYMETARDITAGMAAGVDSEMKQGM